MRHINKTTPDNIYNRALRLAAHVRASSTAESRSNKRPRYVGNEQTKFACAAFDRMLDELLNEDFFGTEGQNDPRGDRRD